MGRPEILLAVPEDPSSGALEKVLEILRGDRTHRFEVPPLIYLGLEEIDEKLEARSCKALFDTMVVVLLPAQERWPKFANGMSLTINSESHRSPLLELACQYPEVYWVFVRHPEDEEETEGYKALLAVHQVSWEDHVVGGDSRRLEHLAYLVERHGSGFRTLFDPTGLRAAAHWLLMEKKAEQSVSIHALSIEDESSFALFNGYVLFRQGFSTYLASTRRETQRLLGDPSIRFSAVIEDLFLNFCDGDRINLRKEAMLPMDIESPEELLTRRMSMFPNLEKESTSFYHLVISAAVPEHPSLDVIWTTKPYGGMFAKEIEEAKEKIKKIRFPRGEKQASNYGEIDPDHGIPGALHVLAENLIRRAGEALNERSGGASAAAAVHAAVLALEARRCLADSKSSLDLTALSLQHKAEVIADCMFIGTMTDLNAEKRLLDLKESIERTLGTREAASNTVAKCEIQRLDAMMHIATELSSIYDACGQFDEAELLRRSVLRYQLDIRVARSTALYALVSEIRRGLHDNRLEEGRDVACPEEIWQEGDHQWAKGVLGLTALPVIGFKYYIGALLRNGWIIVGFCLLWVILFGAVYLVGAPETVSLKNVAQSLLTSGFFFVSGNAPPIPSPGAAPTLFFGGAAGQFAYQAVVFLNCLWGFVHLGIFIAYLYSKVARK
jgi:hypothetical protein